MTLISPSLLAFGRNANHASPRHLGTRYDTEGRFLPEPGNTVVSHVTAGSPSEAAVLGVRDRLMAMPEARQFAFCRPCTIAFRGMVRVLGKRCFLGILTVLDSSLSFSSN